MDRVYHKFLSIFGRRRSNPPKIIIETTELKRSIDFSDINIENDNSRLYKENVFVDESRELDDTYVIASSHSHLMDETLNVELILRDIGLEKYIKKFMIEEIDMFVFSMLNEHDLIELEIDEEDRKTILKAVELYSDCYGS